MSNEYAIEINNLVKKYDDLHAVDGISFKIKCGEIFAFLGPNGAGKTTTVEIIEGVRKATSGEVKVLGNNVNNKRALTRIKRIIGTLPQEFSTHWELTVYENIRYWAKLYRTSLSIDYLIQLVKLGDKRNTRYKNLSGGLKRRLGIAIALVNDPQIVFLDEPTTGLDPRARRDTWEIIRGLQEEGKTIFLTTHYMEEAQILADRVAIIHKGKIMAIGTPTELIDKYGGENKVIIRTSSAESRDKIYQLLLEMGPLEDAEGDIVISSKRGTISKIIDLLEDNNLSYLDIITHRPTLEEVFLTLTGETIQSAHQIEPSKSTKEWRV
ncbi:MAG: ATP-binding cassette domain-containing protein [Candidatus Heimdallarchaeota archaeon]|nr:ATP-binding cassette domain-containing protein [Candidatus Heimdallarchaeota archaeon]